MMEGSGSESGSALATNGSGCGSAALLIGLNYVRKDGRKIRGTGQEKVPEGELTEKRFFLKSQAGIF
jgi:hypothetical protein